MKQKSVLVFLLIVLFIFSSLPAVEAFHLGRQRSPGLQFGPDQQIGAPTQTGAPTVSSDSGVTPSALSETLQRRQQETSQRVRGGEDAAAFTPSTGRAATAGWTPNRIVKFLAGRPFLGNSILEELTGAFSAIKLLAGWFESPDGTARNPTYTFSSGRGKGMFAPAEGTVGFSTRGQERMRITGDGNVGIGTASPTAMLDVHGNVKVIGAEIRDKLIYKEVFRNVCEIAPGLFVLSVSETCPSGGGGGGGGTVTISTHPDNVPARYLVMSTTDNEVYKLRLATGSDPVTVTGIVFTNNNAAGSSTLHNFKLYDGNNLLAGPVSTAAFTGFSLSLAANTSKALTLKTDVKTRLQGAISGSVHEFGVAANSDVSSNGSVTGAPTRGNQQTVYRSKPSLTTSVLGAVSNRIRAAVDDLAALNWGAAPQGDVKIESVRLTFSGAALTTPTTSFAASLIDSNTNAPWGNSTLQTCTPSGSPKTCAVTFSPDYTVAAGTTKTTKLRVDSGGFANTSQQQDGLAVNVTAAGDITWSDGTTSNIPWEAIKIPITVVNIAYE